MALGALEKKESLGEKAYRMLRQAILEGELKPGDILTEEGTAELLAISRTPIRSALQQLTTDGLLKQERKNLIVAGVKEEELHEIDQVRARIEPLSAELCAKKGITPKEEQELWDCCRDQEKAAEEKDAREFFLACERFHVTLAKLSGNSFLEGMIASASTAAVRFMVNSESPERYIDDSPKEHRSILEAIAEGDSKKAAELMSRHISGDA